MKSEYKSLANEGTQDQNDFCRSELQFQQQAVVIDVPKGCEQTFVAPPLLRGPNKYDEGTPIYLRCNICLSHSGLDQFFAHVFLCYSVENLVAPPSF